MKRLLQFSLAFIFIFHFSNMAYGGPYQGPQVEEAIKEIALAEGAPIILCAGVDQEITLHFVNPSTGGTGTRLLDAGLGMWAGDPTRDRNDENLEDRIRFTNTPNGVLIENSQMVGFFALREITASVPEGQDSIPFVPYVTAEERCYPEQVIATTYIFSFPGSEFQVPNLAGVVGLLILRLGAPVVEEPPVEIPEPGEPVVSPQPVDPPGSDVGGSTEDPPATEEPQSTPTSDVGEGTSAGGEEAASTPPQGSEEAPTGSPLDVTLEVIQGDRGTSSGGCSLVSESPSVFPTAAFFGLISLIFLWGFIRRLTLYSTAIKNIMLDC